MNKNSYEEVLETVVSELKEENRNLIECNKELIDRVTELEELVDEANEDYAEGQKRICGEIVVSGDNSSCQDLVSILLINGYTLELTPLEGGLLNILIKESEDEINE